jgi:hypothetical protein
MLNNKSKIFTNAAVVFDFNLNASERPLFPNSTDEYSLTLRYKNNNVFRFSFGGGYNYNERLSFELKYNVSKKIFDSNFGISGNISSFSLLLGYKIF